MINRFAMATALASCALMTAACHKTGENAGKDVAQPSDSAPVNAVQDVAATAVGAVAAPSAAMTTEGYVTNAAIADMYEVEAGKIAQQRAKRADVKAFGAMMAKDHTATTAGLKDALKKANLAITPPAALDDRRQGMINNLKAAGDADFDGAYLHQQLSAHLEALALHKTFAARTDVAPLKAAADATAPKVQAHLDMVRKIGGDLLKDAAPGGETPAGGSTAPHEAH